MKQTNKICKKIIIALIIIIVVNFSFAYKSNATGVATAIKSGGSSLLVKPICWCVVALTDAVNFVSTIFFVDKTQNSGNDNWNSWNQAAQDFSNGKLVDGWYDLLMSPDKIFSGEISLLNANIFEADNREGKLLSDLWNEIKNGTGGSLAPALKRTVSGVYMVLRNIAALILLCLLIYTGIRVLLSSASPYKQAEWKKHLIDWVKALCLLMFVHVIMIGIFYISDALVNTLKAGFNGFSITANIRKSFDQTSIWDPIGLIIVTIMYLYVTYLTIVFFVSYFKRLVWIVMLIVISPIVSITDALGVKSKIFNKWFKEFISAVLIQPFHMLIFYVLVGLPLGIMGASANATFMETAIANFNPFNSSSLIIYIYMLLSISMIRPAEKFFTGLLEVNGQVANQASTESGVKTIKRVEETVEKGAKLVGEVALVAATAGAAAPGVAAAETTAMATTATETTAMAATDATAMAATDATAMAATDATAMAATDATTMAATDATTMAATDATTMGTGNTINFSNAEFDDAMGDKSVKSNKLMDRLMDRLEDKHPNSYAKVKEVRDRVKPYTDALNTPNMQESFNEFRSAANELRNTMYLDNAPQEWKEGAFGYDKTKAEIDATKKEMLNSFVNNKNNINYMMQQHGLDKDEAKARLKEAEPFIDRGITDVGVVDKMIAEQKLGKSPNQAIRSVANSNKIEARTNNVINDKSKISAIAQIISRQTGERADSPKVIEQAKQTMKEARPYIEKGEKDPEVLNRLVQFEHELKNAKFGANARTPDKVMRMDRKMDKALKDGLSKVDMKTTQTTSQGIKQLESVMNKELRNRRATQNNG